MPEQQNQTPTVTEPAPQPAPVTDINLTDPATPPVEPVKEPEGAGEKLLAGKYKTPEELEKAYKELEAKLGNNSSSLNEPVKDLPQKTEPPETPQKEITVAGLPAQKYFDEYAANGTLSEDSYKELADKGIPREIVDAYIDGRKAVEAHNAGLTEDTVNKLMNEVGGEQPFRRMAAWAYQNYSEQDKADYQAAIDSGSPALARLALATLKAKYEAAYGSAPALVDGAPAPGSPAYRSKAEMVQAMRDPRYKTDPAYRAEVERKVAAMRM